MNVLIGLTMLILGGLSAGSSYVPLKGVKGWAWESGWAVQGIVAWLLLPLLLALLATPHLFSVLKATPLNTLAVTYAFGFLWGVGGLAWGMAVRYIGIALGFSIATGFLSSLGTLVPIIAAGKFAATAATTSGRITIASIALSLIGITICGRAGWLRDKTQQKNTAFNFKKGITLALAAGILGACFAFGIGAGDGIKQNAMAAGAAPQYASFPIFFVELLGGITVNGIYCLWMNRRNKTFNNYRQAANNKTLRTNYAFSALVGALWYLQFVFYGMASFYMGPYSFANWSIHMSFMVVASNLWGYYYKEWKEAPTIAIRWNNTGIAVLVIAGIVMGIAQSTTPPVAVRSQGQSLAIKLK
jgi:L-rhamnose-H+ transport protein